MVRFCRVGAGFQDTPSTLRSMEKKPRRPQRDAGDPRDAGPAGPRRTHAVAAGAAPGRGLSEWAGAARQKRGNRTGEADRISGSTARGVASTGRTAREYDRSAAPPVIS